MHMSAPHLHLRFVRVSRGEPLSRHARARDCGDDASGGGRNGSPAGGETERLPNPLPSGGGGGGGDAPCGGDALHRAPIRGGGGDGRDSNAADRGGGGALSGGGDARAADKRAAHTAVVG